MRNIHVISHTHWDREWYHSFQQFRLKLIRLMDELLDILEENPDFKFFMLDGQTIVLEDYLQMRPEKENILRQHVQSGRVIIGPWHILPDMFLVGPESHIRNLLEGEKTTRRFGEKMMVGYMPDSFGHIGQMPQILRGFEIDSACLWRGLDDEPAEFWWQSPDGSRVLMAYLRDSYSSGAHLPGEPDSLPQPQRDASQPQRDASQPQRDASQPQRDASQERFAASLAELGRSMANFSAAQDHLVMLGTDHMQPSRHTGKNIERANVLLGPDVKVIHSTLQNYLSAIQHLRNDSLPTVHGELRKCKRSHLLPGVLSTRMWIKQRNTASENLLTQWVEPFSAFTDWTLGPCHQSSSGLPRRSSGLPRSSSGLQPFAPVSSTRLRQPAQIIRQAWRLLMENHPHDSICGCSIDQVHEEMKVRFDQVDQIGEELTRQNLQTLSALVRTIPSRAVESALGAVIVFNPGPYPRTDRVEAEINLEGLESGFSIRMENGEKLPYDRVSGSSGSSDLLNVRMSISEFRSAFQMVHEGRVSGMGIRAYKLDVDGPTARVDITLSELGPDREVWATAVKESTRLMNNPLLKEVYLRAHTPSIARVSFTAPQVPGLGWRAFTIHAEEDTRPPQQMPAWIRPLLPLMGKLASNPSFARILERLQPKTGSKPPYIIENEYFCVDLEPDGTLIVLDKNSGRSLKGLNRFVDEGDAGDEYNFSPPAQNPHQTAHLVSASKQRGAAQQTITANLLLHVPQSLSADRASRSKQMVDLRITSIITLSAGVPRIDIHTQVDNQAHDHRLRVHFQTPWVVDNAEYDSAFQVLRRPLGVPEFDRQTWVEDPRPEVPQRAFTSVIPTSSGSTADVDGLTIANRGLPEVEVIRTRSGSEIALTLLRCVGWLSRDDLATRRGHAGPAVATLAAQMPGQWSFDYAIIPHSAADIPDELQRHTPLIGVRDFTTPMRAESAPLQDGALPSEGSFLQIRGGPFVLSSVKQSEDGSGWIVRGYNPLTEGRSSEVRQEQGENQVYIRPLWPFTQAAITNLAETQREPLPIDPQTGEISLTVKPGQISTLWLAGIRK